MKLRIVRNAAQASRAVARTIVRQLQKNPASVLALPTGRTAVPIYDELARLYVRGRVDFSKMRTFNLDELVDPRSPFRAFMDRHLFTRVDVPPRRIHFLNGSATNLTEECERFEQKILAAGGIDLMILGIGTNGHIAFNEPQSRHIARTHVARLAPATRRANAWLFGNRLADVPREGLTMGMGTILGARTIVLVATGVAKARAVAHMTDGRVTPQWPASFLQLHADLHVIVDSAASSLLR